MAPWYVQILAAVGLFGPPLLAFIHALRRRPGDWDVTGRSKRFWLAVIALSSPVGLGPLAAILYVVFVPPVHINDLPVELTSAR